MKQLFGAIIIILFCSMIGGCGATSNSSQSNAADRWYTEKSWLNGLQRTPHESVDREEFVKQYNQNKALWDKAFVYLKETDLGNIKPGRYAIEGEKVCSLVTEGATKDVDKTRWGT